MARIGACVPRVTVIRARLQSIASAPHGHEGIAHYDGRCRHLSEGERQTLGERKNPSWRMKVEPRLYEFTDFGKVRSGKNLFRRKMILLFVALTACSPII